MALQSRLGLIFWGLGLLALVVLAAHLPDVGDVDLTLWLLFAALVALMLNLGTRLDEVVVSPAPTAVLMAYLTTGQGDWAPDALWSVAAGVLLGNVVWVSRALPGSRAQGRQLQALRSAAISVSQFTLALFVSGWAYQRFDGRLPLTSLEYRDVLPLSALVAIFLAIYFAIMLLEAQLYRRRTPRMVARNWQGLVGIILLPVPFAVVGAVAYHQLSSLSFGVLIGGLLIIVAGVHVISRAHVRDSQQVRELWALTAISQAMRANLDLEALLGIVFDQVARLLQVDTGTVALYDAPRNTLTFPLNRVGQESVPLAPREARDDGLLEAVIFRQKPLLLTDQVARRADAMGLAGPDVPAQSWLGVPLVAADKVLGCMAVVATRPGQTFTNKDLHWLATLAGQAGIAIDNTMLYLQARDRSVQLATLNNIASLLSATLDVQQVMDLVGSSAVAVASCDAVALYVWQDAVQGPLMLARHNGFSDAFVAEPPAPLVLDVEDLRRRRQPLIVTDALIDQRAERVRASMLHEGKRAWLECVLRKGDDLLGVLVFYYHEPRRFAPEEVELLRAFSNQAALAISNARLYTQTDAALGRRIEQLSALADISRELSSTLSLQGLFQLVLDRALEATRSRSGMLLLHVDDDSPPPVLVAERGLDLSDRSPLSGSVAHTYHSGLPTLTPNLADEPEIMPLDEHTRAQLTVPVTRGEAVLGVMALGSDQPNGYGADDLTFVMQLATQARIAIDNARLFRRIEIARDRLQIILDSMKEAVILITADGLITLANPRVQRILGVDPARVLNVPIRTLLADSGLEVAERLGFHEHALLSMLDDLRYWQWESSTRAERVTYEIHDSVSPRFIDRTIAPVRNDGGQVIGVLMVFTDVTEERELAQARKDFSSMIVHDLRGPLTAIMTSIKLLNEIAAQDDALGSSVRDTTDASLRAVRKLLNLVDSLLDVSKLESGVLALEREPADLAAMCRSIVDELAPLAEELEVELGLDLPADLPVLDVDAEKIERVLLNLIDNAIKFTPAGGSVCVQARVPGAHDQGDQAVRLDVVDTGPGVPDEYKERLFDRFAQIKGQHGRRRGTGLGLTFCKMAVEAHGGAIWIEDNPEGGAVFSLTLPVVDLSAWE